MGDEEPELRSGRGTPGMHAGDRTGTFEPDPGLAAGILPVAIFGKPGLMGAPPEFGGLKPFGDEPLDRPRVDEDAPGARYAARLRVPLRDMHALDAQRLHQARPAVAVGGHLRLAAGVLGQRHQRFLDEPAHHARIGATATHRCRAAGVARLLVPDRLAQRIVGPFGVVGGAEIVARPGLHHRVDIEHAELAHVRHDIER